jgi:acetyl esterase/lipase
MKKNSMWLKFVASALLSAVVGVAEGAAHKPMTLADYMRLSGPNPTEKLSYGGSPFQFVELFQPGGLGPFPVVVLIHGGCFKNEYQGMPQMRGIAGVLSSEGIAVWSIEYRGVDESGGGYPGTFQDINAAFDLLVMQAVSRHFDIDRITAVGHSAGAYLALWMAGRGLVPVSSPLHDSQPIQVRNVVALGGFGDLRPDAEHLQDACGYSISQLTGAPSSERQDVYADTTPLELSPNGSHTVFINGELDNLASPQEARVYAERVRRRGDSAETVVLPAASHFDEVSIASPSWPVVLDVIRRVVGVEKK